MNVSVVGLGKLGAALAAWISSKGHSVIGVDVNPQAIKAISDGNVAEPGVNELVAQYPFHMTTNLQKAVKESEITFILVPTPSDDSGAFSLDYVRAACENIAIALRDKDAYHLVVIVSTVMPGHTQQIADLMERLSKKKCGSDFGLCYSPEFVALGSVLRDMENPDFILIGESDDRAGEMLEMFYHAVYGGFYIDDNPRVYIPPPIRRMSFVNAEIAKLSLNCYVTMKISYANMVGELAGIVPGANSDTILQAIGHDSRIGKKYLKSGVGYGGPCFPRDGRALISALGSEDWPYLVHATTRTNRDVLMRLLHTVEKWCTPRDTVGILGLAYKVGTPVTEESQGQRLAEITGAITYDKLAPCSHTYEEVLGQATVLVVMLPEWTDLSASKAKMVLDPWRCVEKVPEGCVHIRMGKNEP